MEPPQKRIYKLAVMGKLSVVIKKYKNNIKESLQLLKLIFMKMFRNQNLCCESWDIDKCPIGYRYHTELLCCKSESIIENLKINLIPFQYHVLVIPAVCRDYFNSGIKH